MSSYRIVGDLDAVRAQVREGLRTRTRAERRAANQALAEPSRWCARCQTTKPISKFWNADARALRQTCSSCRAKIATKKRKATTTNVRRSGDTPGR